MTEDLRPGSGQDSIRVKIKMMVEGVFLRNEDTKMNQKGEFA